MIPVAVMLLMLLAMALLFVEAEEKQQLMIGIGLPITGLLLLSLGSWSGGIYVARRGSLSLGDNGIRFDNPLPVVFWVKPS